MVLSVLRTLQSWFRPLLVALFGRNIPWNLRWRMLLLQPTSLITYSISSVPYIFSRPFTVEFLPVFPERSPVRALAFKAPGTGKGRALRPLHVDIHGGAFIGGIPEHHAVFYERIAKHTGAVVVSFAYRYAPEHTFPAAIDDVDATIKWIQENAASRWGADPTLMTVGGSSSGGNLALAATQQPNCHAPSPTCFKASVTFCAVIDLRLSPPQKPKPANFPKSDPLAVIMPLFDAYASPARAKHMNDPRMSPVLAARETLPERMLMIVPAIDILFNEQTSFAERINEEDKRDGNRATPRIEVQVEEKGFHGYAELPDAILDKDLRESKERTFVKGVEFLKETYALYGWSYDF